MLRRPLAVAVAVAGLLALAVAPADARRPVASNDCSVPTLSGPAAVATGSEYTVTGCGFAPNSFVAIEITEAGGCCIAYNVGTDSTGRLELTRTAWWAGDYRVRAAVERRNYRMVTVAEWSFTAS